MKCPQCGYVSFDDLEECKVCGAALRAPEQETDEEKTVKSRLQEELFSLKMTEDESGPSSSEDMTVSSAETPPSSRDEEESRLDGIDEAEGAVSARAAAEVVRLPNMDVDFDPGAEEPETPAGTFSDRTFSIGLERREAEPVIDDETSLPEDLWIHEGAGFFPRLAAFAIDSLILAAVLLLFFGGALLALNSDGYGWSHVSTPEGISALFVPFYLLGLVVSLSYFTFFHGWMAKTPGKTVLRLDVRRTDGAPMSYSRAFLRWVGYLVSITFAGLGFLWIFFDERKRGWHDYLSGTWVKNLRNETEGGKVDIHDAAE